MSGTDNETALMVMMMMNWKRDNIMSSYESTLFNIKFISPLSLHLPFIKTFTHLDTR